PQHPSPPTPATPPSPTRRSSDLPKITEIDTVESYDGDFTLRLEFRASRDANSGLHLREKAFAHQLQIRDYPRVPGGPEFQAEGEDRKSTRLNSSHVSISYAVFCL